jgi:hypothetical protein
VPLATLLRGHDSEVTRAERELYALAQAIREDDALETLRVTGAPDRDRQLARHRVRAVGGCDAQRVHAGREIVQRYDNVNTAIGVRRERGGR